MLKKIILFRINYLNLLVKSSLDEKTTKKLMEKVKYYEKKLNKNSMGFEHLHFEGQEMCKDKKR